MSLDAISINTNIKTATNIFEAVYSDQLLHIAESAQDREWEALNKKQLTEFLYAKYNIASLADLKDNGMYAGNHTGVNMTMDIVNNYNMEELHQYLQQAMRKEFGVRMSFLSHIMRIMPYHQYLEFDGFNLIHDPKIQNYTAVGLWFLNSNKKDEIVFLDQHKKMQLAKNMIVIVDKNPMMSFQIKSKRNEPIYVVVLYYY